MSRRSYDVICSQPIMFIEGFEIRELTDPRYDVPVVWRFGCRADDRADLDRQVSHALAEMRYHHGEPPDVATA